MNLHPLLSCVVASVSRSYCCSPCSSCCSRPPPNSVTTTNPNSTSRHNGSEGPIFPVSLSALVLEDFESSESTPLGLIRGGARHATHAVGSAGSSGIQASPPVFLGIFPAEPRLFPPILERVGLPLRSAVHENGSAVHQHGRAVVQEHNPAALASHGEPSWAVQRYPATMPARTFHRTFHRAFPRGFGQRHRWFHPWYRCFHRCFTAFPTGFHGAGAAAASARIRSTNARIVAGGSYPDSTSPVL